MAAVINLTAILGGYIVLGESARTEGNRVDDKAYRTDIESNVTPATTITEKQILSKLAVASAKAQSTVKSESLRVLQKARTVSSDGKLQNTEIRLRYPYPSQTAGILIYVLAVFSLTVGHMLLPLVCVLCCLIVFDAVLLRQKSAFGRLLYGLAGLRINISQTYLGFSEFPEYWKPMLMGHLLRTWSDIHSIQVQNFTYWNASTWKKRDWRSTHLPIGLQIHFNSGGYANIPFGLISKSEAIKLFETIEYYADPGTLSTEAVQVKESLLSDGTPYDSFTSLWQENFAAKYATTNFGLLPPNHILQDGRYQIITQIAGGGMSAVYLAKKDTGEKVVIKETVLPLDTYGPANKKASEMIEREAHILSQLSHPQIIRVLDYFVERQRIYLVLEFIAGTTLRQLVFQHGPMAANQVLDLTAQLANILGYLHDQNPPLIHRDISPDNIILRSDNKLVLIDFGAANEFIKNVTGTLIGKQSYIAPEQFRGKAEPRSDIYSLGGTVYFLLTGKDPIPLSEAHPHSINAKISPELDALVSACTAQESVDRPGSAQDLLAQLKRITSLKGL